MTSEPIGDPLANYLITPQDGLFVLTGYESEQVDAVRQDLANEMYVSTFRGAARDARQRPSSRPEAERHAAALPRTESLISGDVRSLNRSR
jgi:hypothetical protein